MPLSEYELGGETPTPTATNVSDSTLASGPQSATVPWTALHAPLYCFSCYCICLRTHRLDYRQNKLRVFVMRYRWRRRLRRRLILLSSPLPAEESGCAPLGVWASTITGAEVARALQCLGHYSLRSLASSANPRGLLPKESDSGYRGRGRPPKNFHPEVAPTGQGVEGQVRSDPLKGASSSRTRHY